MLGSKPPPMTEITDDFMRQMHRPHQGLLPGHSEGRAKPESGRSR